MSIDRIGPDSRRPEAPSRAEDRARVGPVRETPKARAIDRVEISGEGRALAAHSDEARELGLPPEHVAEIRSRLEDGFYQRDAVLDLVARRILRSGDL
jgi:anti-sigma28 factor (negative regulator of flagellin synthesis)